jgi:hypothetical protein
MGFRRTITVTKTAKLEPIDIYGNWVVTAVGLAPGTPQIGIDPQIPSKFSIRNQGRKHVLKKTAGVRWNGNRSGKIELHGTRKQIHAHNNIALVATITLDGTKLALALGSDDSGNTLKIEVAPITYQITNPGGSGSAGRGT